MHVPESAAERPLRLLLCRRWATNKFLCLTCTWMTAPSLSALLEASSAFLHCG